MIRTILTGVSALAIVTGGAIAQDAENPIQIETSQAAEIDLAATAAPLDATAVTTKNDARLFAVAEFNLADANADGLVDQDEFVAYATANAEKTEAKTANEEVGGVAEINGEGDMAVVAEAAMPAAPEEIFVEISEGEKTINQVKLVEARVADFDEADVNNDETLDDFEKVKFAALVIGRDKS